MLRAAVATPSGTGPFPGVLLLHGTHGFARQYVEVASELARDGFIAVAATEFRQLRAGRTVWQSVLRHVCDQLVGPKRAAPRKGLKGHINQAIMAIMKKASITEAKNNLSALIDSVKGGSPVLIVDRGRPVARLEPVSGGRFDDDSRLARLVREGIVRPGRRSLAKDLFATPPPRVKKGASGVRALLDERRDGR